MNNAERSIATHFDRKYLSYVRYSYLPTWVPIGTYLIFCNDIQIGHASHRKISPSGVMGVVESSPTNISVPISATTTRGKPVR